MWQWTDSSKEEPSKSIPHAWRKAGLKLTNERSKEQLSNQEHTNIGNPLLAVQPQFRKNLPSDLESRLNSHQDTWLESLVKKRKIAVESKTTK